MIVGLGAGAVAPRRRGARRLPSQQLRSSAVRSRGCARAERAVALTFDDGPNPGRDAADSRRAHARAACKRHVLHSRPTRRAVAGAREARRRRRPRDRQPRLLPPKAALQVARLRSQTISTLGTQAIERASGVSSAALSRAARLSESVGDVDRAVARPANRRAGRSASGTRTGPASR